MKTKRIHQDVYISVLLYIVSFFSCYIIKIAENSAIFPVLLIVAFAILNTSLLINGIKKTKVIWNEAQFCEFHQLEGYKEALIVL